MVIIILQESKVRFHVVGLKCAECGSYNTSREGEEGAPVMPPIPAAADAVQGDDEWETEDEEEIVGGEEGEENEAEVQAATDDGLNLSEVQLNVDGDSNNVLPLD